MEDLRQTTLIIATAAAVGLAACAIDTVPLPDLQHDKFGAGGGAGAPGAADDKFGDHGIVPIVGINSTSIYWADEGPFIYLVGVSGAFPGAGPVVVNNPSRGDEYRSAAAADGSFAAAINARVFDTIQVSFIQDNSIIDSVLIDLIPASVEAYAGISNLDGTLPPSAAGGSDPDVRAESSMSSGMVTVYGEPSLLPAGIGVIIANPRLGVAVRALTEADGSFSAVIAATPGDELLVFTVEPAASNGGSSTLTLVVP